MSPTPRFLMLSNAMFSKDPNPVDRVRAARPDGCLNSALPPINRAGVFCCAHRAAGRLRKEIKPMSDEYQGWTNYETWCVQLWLNNEEAPYRHWTEQAQEVWADTELDEYLTRSEAARRQLAERLQGAIEEGDPLDGASVYHDLLTSAIGDVNWSEIANAWLEPLDGYEAAVFPHERSN